MRDTIFVVGATSVGKSAFALALAERCGGEIVNADAFQVYRGLALLTAQPGEAELGRAPHHLFGYVPAESSYNVAQYAHDAAICLAGIHRRGRPAVIVGGTGLYVKALTHGLSPLPLPDQALRDRLEALPLEDLIEELARIDPAAPAQIDLKNRRRVSRALEICAGSGKPLAAQRENWKHPRFAAGEAGFYLVRDRGELHARIGARVDTMFQEGVVDEVRTLPAMGGVGTAEAAIGVRDIRAYLRGAANLAACIEAVKIQTRQYAKRQATWFKKEQVFRRLDLSCAPSAGGDFAAVEWDR